MANELAYYDQSELWGNPPEPYETAILNDILSILPDDVESVLDAGCGDGYITNSLPEHLAVTAMDISGEALKQVKRRTRRASVTEIPFSAQAFDLVMINDVMEHIPEAQFAKACRELQRVSGKYLIVTVPYMENLASRRTRCAACGGYYHLNHHQRAFDLNRIRGLFDEFVLDCAVFSGEAWGSELDWVVASQVESANYAHLPNNVCPHCGAKGAAVRGITNEKMLEWYREWQARMLSRNPQLMDLRALRSEIICLLRRPGACADNQRIPEAKCLTEDKVAGEIENAPTNIIDLERFDQYARADLPLFSPLPTCVADLEVSTGVMT